MILFKKIRISIGMFLLKKRARKIDRKVKAINLQDVRTIGIVFNAAKVENDETIKWFKKEFSGDAQFEIFGFIPDNKMAHRYIGDKFSTYFAPKDCNFFFHPVVETIKSFVEKEIDLLLVLDLDYHFPIHYITKLSRARFKAGLEGDYSDDLDFMIHLNEKSLPDLIKHLKHYLGEINQN